MLLLRGRLKRPNDEYRISNKEPQNIERTTECNAEKMNDGTTRWLDFAVLLLRYSAVLLFDILRFVVSEVLHQVIMIHPHHQIAEARG